MVHSHTHTFTFKTIHSSALWLNKGASALLVFLANAYKIILFVRSFGFFYPFHSFIGQLKQKWKKKLPTNRSCFIRKWKHVNIVGMKYQKKLYKNQWFQKEVYRERKKNTWMWLLTYKIDLWMVTMKYNRF